MKKIMRSWRIRPDLIKRLIQAVKGHKTEQTIVVERGIELAIRELDRKRADIRL